MILVALVGCSLLGSTSVTEPTWTCACGMEHTGLPLSYGSEAPWRSLVPAEEFAQRVVLSPDQCIVDGTHFFIRGALEIPTEGTDERFVWSVWTSVSRASFDRLHGRWNAVDREGDEPAFGWLMTELPGYPTTLHLKTLVHTRAPGLAPFIEVEPTDHPLAVEQREGIDRQRLEAIAHAVLDGPEGG